MTTVKVKLGALAAEALSGKSQGGGGLVPEDAVRALQYYLTGKRAARAGWAYPEFLSRRADGEAVEFELGVDESLWAALELEAEEQGVSTAQLLEHAILFYVAELDAGRITEKMLDEDLAG